MVKWLKAIEIDMSVSFTVEGLPQSPNATIRQHWAVKAKAKKEWQEKIGWLAKSVRADIHPLKKATITFSIHTGDNRRHDPDNLAWAVSKPTLDAIKGILIEDDSIDNVELIYQYHRDKPRRFKVTVEPRS